MLAAMSYRIQVGPELGSRLRALQPHILLRVGRALAELAESQLSESDAAASELRVDNCVLRLVVDHAQRLLKVIQVEPGEPAYGAEAPA
jgi:hypothetical protein